MRGRSRRRCSGSRRWRRSRGTTVQGPAPDRRMRRPAIGTGTRAPADRGSRRQRTRPRTCRSAAPVRSSRRPSASRSGSRRRAGHARLLAAEEHTQSGGIVGERGVGQVDPRRDDRRGARDQRAVRDHAFEQRPGQRSCRAHPRDMQPAVRRAMQAGMIGGERLTRAGREHPPLSRYDRKRRRRRSKQARCDDDSGHRQTACGSQVRQGCGVHGHCSVFGSMVRRNRYSLTVAPASAQAVGRRRRVVRYFTIVR